MLTLDVCRNAGQFGIDITFAALSGGDLEENFRSSDFKFIRLQRNLPIDFNVVRQLRKIIIENSIEIAHGQQPVEVLHLYLATLGMKNVKIVQTHLGHIVGKKNILSAKYITLKIDANIVCSRGFFQWLRKEIGLDTSKKFYLIYNGVDEKRIQPSGNSLKKELGIDEENLLLGMIANFRPDQTKDQMTVCRALPKVFEKFKDANFIFAGKVVEGGEENFKNCVKFCEEQGIGDKVFFLGKRNDINDVLASLDLFVFSSLSEGLPIAMIEAMLSKIPMIVTDIPPLREVSEDGKFAEIFKAQDADDLSEKILKLLENKNLRDEIAQLAFIYARQKFSIQTYLQGLETLYSDLLDKNESKLDSK